MGMWFKQGFGDEESSDDVGYLVGLGTAFLFKVYCDKHTPGSPEKLSSFTRVLFLFQIQFSLLFAIKHWSPHIELNKPCLLDK